MADRLVAGQAQLAAQARGAARRRRRRAAVEAVIASRRRSVLRPSPAPAADAAPARRDRRRVAWPRTCSWTGTSSAIIARNWSKLSCCSASDRAASGSGWTSTITPSAPTATPPIASGATSQRLPVAWLGSTITGRWRQVVEQRHRRQVHRVAGVRLERPDAALAEDHVRVAGADDVLGGHQPFLDRRAEAALEHHRPGDPPDRASAASSSACSGCRSGGCRRTRRRCRPGSAPSPR